MKYRMKIRTIVLGASGMVGEGVLIEALKHDDVESVLMGLAMIHTVTAGYPKKILEVPDIIQLAGSGSGGSATTPHQRIPER